MIQFIRFAINNINLIWPLFLGERTKLETVYRHFNLFHRQLPIHHISIQFPISRIAACRNFAGSNEEIKDKRKKTKKKEEKKK